MMAANSFFFKTKTFQQTYGWEIAFVNVSANSVQLKFRKGYIQNLFYGFRGIAPVVICAGEFISNLGLCRRLRDFIETDGTDNGIRCLF